MKRAILVVVLLVIAVATSVFGEVPRKLNFQGVLTDDAGGALEGSYEITFRLYNVESDGTALWEETQTVAVVKGTFNATLGIVAPINLPFDEQYYLGISIEDGSELSPRMPLSSSAYSFTSRNTDMLDNLHASAFADSVHYHDDHYFTKEELSTPGTLNDLSNPMDWTKLKNVPTGFADTIDDVGGTGDNHALDAADGSPTDVVYVDNDGNVGIGTSTPLAQLHIPSSGTVLFGADTLGGGSKLMWLPSKSAFRVGRVISTNWAPDSIGDYSFATGWDTKALGQWSTAIGGRTTASGRYSTAMGAYTEASNNASTAMGSVTKASGDGSTAMGAMTTASGMYSIAMGDGTKASGVRSTAMGEYTTASGNSSTAMGAMTTASGANSTTMGYYTKAESYASLVIGRYNVGGGESNTWVETDPLFEIGIGTSGANRANAMTVLKNGNVGVGVTNPVARLEVEGTISSNTGGFRFPDGTVQTTASFNEDGFSLPYADSISVAGNAFVITNNNGSAICGVASDVDNFQDTGGLFLSQSNHGRGVEGHCYGNYGVGLYGSANTGVYGIGTAYGVDGYGEIYGVKGLATAEGDGTNTGGFFTALSNSGRGVYGRASATGDCRNYGGYFTSMGDDGRGIYCHSYGINSIAVEGVGGSSGGTFEGADGLHATGTAPNGYGIRAVGVQTGIEARADDFGVKGFALSADGKAIYGYSASPDSGYGVYGYASNGCGVFGYTPNGHGVYGESPYGYGVYAYSYYGTGLYAKGSTPASGNYAAEFHGNVIIKDWYTAEPVLELGKGLDYAEGFDLTDANEIEPGTILIIDPHNPGKLSVSCKAYDKKVAGIAAGANGMGSGVRLGADQFDCDVALAGRVYCNVDATETAIELGDLLTTSSTHGFAMKATDYQRAQGAILGKAMEKLEKGKKGQILVLVTLQ